MYYPTAKLADDASIRTIAAGACLIVEVLLPPRLKKGESLWGPDSCDTKSNLQPEIATLQSDHYLLQQGSMPRDFTDMSDDVFDDWLRSLGVGGLATGDGLNDERLVELVGATLREAAPEARAQGLVNLANLCYAMADKTLGLRTPSAKCLKIVVSVGQ